MKHSYQTQPDLFFEIEEILPATKRQTEDGCDLCRHCQLIRVFVQRQASGGQVPTKGQTGHHTTRV